MKKIINLEFSEEVCKRLDSLARYYETDRVGIITKSLAVLDLIREYSLKDYIPIVKKGDEEIKIDVS